MKFSIITSFYVWHKLKKQQLDRCINSVNTQTYEDWEHILVNDGSKDDVDYKDTDKRKFYKQNHLERIIALNHGLSKCTGDWICFLDADDEFFSYTLEVMKQIIEKNPDNKIFNCASFHVHRDFSSRLRGSFKPKKLKQGHEVFGGGNIVNGTFFFHRSLYDKLGAYPEKPKMWSPWEFSAEAQKEFPEIQRYFMVDHKDEPNKIVKELGNPWGNDYYLFYKYTRKYHSMPFDIPIYIVHGEGKRPGQQHQIS